MRNLIRYLSLLALLSGVPALAQVVNSCNYGPCPPITASGGTLLITNVYGGMNATFEEIVSGAPATVSITVQGCMRGGTCDTAMDTNTTVGALNRSVVPTAKPYSYFLVTATWTGGTNPSVQINPLITTAKGGGAGGGGTTTNVLTANNSNAGAASGSTFNGASAVTISTNTIGAPNLATANTFSAGLQDMSAADYLMPKHAADPGTCTEGQQYENTVSHTMKLCSTTNTWSALSTGGSASGNAGAVQISAGSGAFTNQANIKASVANGYFGNSDAVSLQYPLDISRGSVTPIAMTTAPFNTISYFNHSLDNPIGGTAGDVRSVQISLTYTGLGSNGTFASSYNQQTANLCNGGTACVSPQVDTHNLVDVARMFANPGTNGTLTVADAFYGTAGATPQGGTVTSLFTFHADGGVFNGTGTVGTVAGFVADMEASSSGPSIGAVFGYRASDPVLYGHGTGGSGCTVGFLVGAGCGGNTQSWAFYDQTNQNSALHALSVGKTTAPGSPLDVVGNINSSTGYKIAGAATNGNCLVGDGTQFVSNTCLSATQSRRTCMILIGAENSAGLANGDIAPQNHQCMIPAASTVIEVDVEGDTAGTPSMNISKNHAGTQTALLSGALGTGAAGAIACANTGGTTGIDGATTCGSTLTTTAIAAGDWIDVTSGTANLAKRVSIAVHYTTP